jgi:hypothetical protein
LCFSPSPLYEIMKWQPTKEVILLLPTSLNNSRECFSDFPLLFLLVSSPLPYYSSRPFMLLLLPCFRSWLFSPTLPSLKHLRKTTCSWVWVGFSLGERSCYWFWWNGKVISLTSFCIYTSPKWDEGVWGLIIHIIFPSLVN